MYINLILYTPTNIYRIIVQVIPLYLAEIAPKQHRGKLVALSSTAAATGILVRLVVGCFFPQESRHSF